MGVNSARIQSPWKLRFGLFCVFSAPSTYSIRLVEEAWGIFGGWMSGQKWRWWNTNSGFRKNSICEKILTLLVSISALGCVTWEASPHLFYSATWHFHGVQWGWIAKSVCHTWNTPRENRKFYLLYQVLLLITHRCRGEPPVGCNLQQILSANTNKMDFLTFRF